MLFHLRTPLFLQKMGGPGQSVWPSLNFPLFLPATPPPPPVMMPAVLQCESDFVQQEPQNRYKLNDFEVGHGPFD